jgi:glycosyltransferase involved in cell wall biosynthesis
MRIALVSTPFLAVPPRDYGGTELVVYELAEGLREHGHQVTLFATGDSRTSAKLESLYAEPQWPPGVLADLNHISWAMQRVARRRFDVVHAHSAVALAMTRLLPDLPLIYTLHHERDEQLSSFYRYFPEVRYIAISEDQKGREIALPNIDVIHHGLCPSYFGVTTQPQEYVAFVGRFARVKGPHTAIDVAACAGLPIYVAGEVHEVDADFGEQEVLPRLQRPHVHYLGVIGMRAKVPLLRDARALLAPIEWNEPFGLILIEAMLSGCPVVAFCSGSVPELIEPGRTGFIVRTAEEMAQVIRPGGVLDNFDRRGCRARAIERFSRERMVTDHERLYARIAAQHAAAARQDAVATESEAAQVPLCA